MECTNKQTALVSYDSYSIHHQITLCISCFHDACCWLTNIRALLSTAQTSFCLLFLCVFLLLLSLSFFFFLVLTTYVMISFYDVNFKQQYCWQDDSQREGEREEDLDDDSIFAFWFFGWFCSMIFSQFKILLTTTIATITKKSHQFINSMKMLYLE